MKEIYSLSNAVISLSNKPESFGRTVLEPLSMGVPVIGYNHGGVGEILKELFPSGAVALNDTDAVIDTLKRLINHQLPEVKTNTTFLLSDMTDQTLQLYQQLQLSPRESQ